MSYDPTRIDMDVDPLSRRMRGVAVHGNTPFDVPYVTPVAENLWTGGCEQGLVLPTEVQHVVSLYPWEWYEEQHELRSSLFVRMYDSIEQTFDQVVGLARWVNTCRADGLTLVHCQAGLNRSALVAATALVLAGDHDPAEAIATLREKRSPAVLCNPAFEAWLLGFDGHA